MKKIFTSFLTTIMLFISAQANAYYLYVGGVLVSDENKDNITGSAISGGKISYNPEKKYLMIADGTTINTTGTTEAINNMDIDDLMIVFEGKVTINSSGSGIICQQKTILTCWTGEKAPVVKITSTNGNPIMSNGGANISMIGLRVTATAKNNHAIFAKNGSPSISFAYTQLVAEAPESYAGIKGFYSGINFTASTLSSNYQVSGGTVVNSSNEVVNAVYIYPYVMLGALNLKPQSGESVTNLTTSNTGASSASGTAQYDSSTKTLTLNNVNLDGAQLITHAPDLKVAFSGGGTIRSSSYTFDVYGNTAITSDGTVNIISTVQDAVYNNGAYNISITAPAFTAQAAKRGIIAQSQSSTLSLNKYGASSVYKFVGATANMLVKNLVMNDMDISTGNTYWNISDGYTYYNGEIAKGSSYTDLDYGTWFKSTNQISYFSLWVAGTHVRTNNTQYITSPYMNKIASYDNNTKTLTFNGATISGLPSDGAAEKRSAIYSAISGLTINATGTNDWTSEGITLNLGGGGTYTITGSGNLNITSNQYHAINTWNSTSLTLARSGGIMAMKAKDRGFYGTPNSTLTFNKEGSGAIYKFAGENGNITDIPNLTFGSGVNISTACMWFNTDEGKVFYQGALAKASDVGELTATCIRSDVTWTSHPVYVAGTQLYTYNGYNLDFWNKYVKGGNIVYNPSTQTLTLYDADIDYTLASGTSNDGIIMTNANTTLKIRVEGNNTLEGTTSYAGLWFRQSNVTIYGNGTLSVPGGRSDNLYGMNGSTVTVQGNVTLEAPTRGIGTNNDMQELIVGGNAVVKAKQVSCLKALTLKEGKRITEPDNAVFNAETKRIELPDGSLAKNVVIQESYGLEIAGTMVTPSNCADILGNGVFSYDNYTKTLTISGDFTSPKTNDCVVESFIEGLTINVASNSTIVSNTDDYQIIFGLHKSTTITGGLLRLESPSSDKKVMGIFLSEGTLTFDDAQVTLVGDYSYGITGLPDADLVIMYSDIMATASEYGAIVDWGNISLTGCFVVEPYPWQFLNNGIADGSGNIVGFGSEGTVFISSDPDAINTVSVAEAAVEDIYDLSGRKLDQTRSGVNIIRGKDGKAVKVLRK